MKEKKTDKSEFENKRKDFPGASAEERKRNLFIYGSHCHYDL
jgi:hypothetical protein